MSFASQLRIGLLASFRTNRSASAARTRPPAFSSGKATASSRGHDSPLGELDIIAVDGRTVVFVEVKTRTSDRRRPSDRSDRRPQAAPHDAGRPGVSQSEAAAANTRPASTSSPSPGRTIRARPHYRAFQERLRAGRRRPVFQLMREGMIPRRSTARMISIARIALESHGYRFQEGACPWPSIFSSPVASSAPSAKG